MSNREFQRAQTGNVRDVYVQETFKGGPQTYIRICVDIVVLQHLFEAAAQNFEHALWNKYSVLVLKKLKHSLAVQLLVAFLQCKKSLCLGLFTDMRQNNCSRIVVKPVILEHISLLRVILHFFHIFHLFPSLFHLLYSLLLSFLSLFSIAVFSFKFGFNFKLTSNKLREQVKLVGRVLRLHHVLPDPTFWPIKDSGDIWNF